MKNNQKNLAWVYAIWAETSYNNALEHLGRALHPLQDKYAHDKWRSLEKGKIPASPHTTYLQRFYDDEREYRYLYESDKDNP